MTKLCALNKLVEANGEARALGCDVRSYLETPFRPNDIMSKSFHV